MRKAAGTSGLFHVRRLALSPGAACHRAPTLGFLHLPGVMMKAWFPVLCASALAAGSASAQTFRWASQGDIQTMDPVSQNESFTNAFNGQIYEFLVARDKDL